MGIAHLAGRMVIDAQRSQQRSQRSRPQQETERIRPMPPLRPRPPGLHEAVLRNHEEWTARQAARAEPATTSTELAVPEPQYLIDTMGVPEPEQVDGAALFTHTAQWFGSYIAFPDLESHVRTVLWNVHALARNRGEHGIGPLIWRSTPRLGVTSKENKSGKSTVLDLSRMLQRTTRPLKITGYALANKIGHKHEALILDEAKLVFGNGGAAADVQSIMLGGYTPGATWEYGHNSSNVEIPLFGPVAYAAKDDLITGTRDRLADMFDRTLWVRMDRASRLMPQPDEDCEDDAILLNQSLIDWTNANQLALRTRARDLARMDQEASAEAASDGREIDARRPQIIRPLLACADVAGGPWPILARRALLGDGTSYAAAERAGEIAGRAERWAPFDTEGGTS